MIEHDSQLVCAYLHAHVVHVNCQNLELKPSHCKILVKFVENDSTWQSTTLCGFTCLNSYVGSHQKVDLKFYMYEVSI